MPRTIEFDGMSFGPSQVRGVRGSIIQIRDYALQRRHMDSAVVLSHAIVLLEELAEILEESP